MHALSSTNLNCGTAKARSWFFSLLTLVLTLGSLAAQEPGNPSRTQTVTDYSALGYLRFINATGHDGKLRVLLDGEDINPSGYSDGFATGAVGFLPKTCQIEMRHESLGEFKLSIILKPGEIASIVALPIIRSVKEKGPSTRDSAPEPPKVELGAQAVFSPGYVRGKDISVTILQATVAEKLEVKVGSLLLTCPKLEPATVGLGKGMGENVPVSIGEKILLSLNFVDPSDRIVILFPNKEGVLKNITLNNEVF